MSVRLLAALLVLIAAPSFAADPRYYRDLERQGKAAQARAMRKRLMVQDFDVARPAVTVDAYRFNINVLPKEGRLEGTLTGEFTATDDLADLTLDASALQVTKAWFTNSAGVRSETTFDLTAESVKVRFPTPVVKDAKFSLTLAYGVAGDKRDGYATEVYRGLYFVNGDGSRSDVTPAVYTSVEPELARTWFPCIDDPSYKARRLSMSVTVPDGWYAVSNGALKSTTMNGGTKTFDWELGFAIPTYLISLSISPYIVIEDRWENTPVNYYVPKSLEALARVEFARTPQMVDLYSKLWVPYPFEKYSVTTVPHYTGAMEHTTATTLTDTYITGDLEAEDTYAHELAHHWWGNLVTNATWDDLWLNEGFATYAEVLFNERFKGADAALESLIWNRDSYFEFDEDGTKAVVDTKVIPDDKFSPAVYEKGAWVLHMLRKTLGDTVYFGAETAYLKKYAFANASTTELRKAFEETSGRDLGEFFQQWVYTPGYPELDVKWSFDKPTRAFSVTVTQRQKTPFHFPLEILASVHDEKGTGELQRLTLDVKQAQETFTFVLSMAGFTGLAVDPELKLLKKLTAERSLDEIRFWLGNSSWVVRLEALESVAPEAVTLELARDLLGRFEGESSESVRVALLEKLKLARKIKGFTDADFQAIQAILVRALGDRKSEVRHTAAEVAKEYLTPELTELAANQLQTEKSDRVKGKLAVTLAAARAPRAFELLLGEFQLARQSQTHRKLIVQLIEAFGKLRDQRAAAVLVDLVNGTNPYFQLAALEHLGELALPDTFELIVGILKDDDRSTELRISSCKSLAYFGGIPAARALSEQLKVEENDEVKAAIKSALARLGGVSDLQNLSLEPASEKAPSVFLRW